MDKYINADDLMQNIAVEYDKYNPQSPLDSNVRRGISLVGELIKKQPTADVQPVKHGRWIAKQKRKPNYNYGVPYEDYHCSQCTYKLSDNGLVSRYNYCPNCGARMDGARDD